MFENSKWICSEKDYGNTPRVYFCDLNIIYPLKRAVLHVSATGIYNVYAGKDKVGDAMLVADGAVCDKHCEYQSYDITSLVAESDFLYIFVASGQNVDKTKKNLPTKQFSDEYGVIAQIDFEFAGGLRQTIVTDERWTCGVGNTTESDINNGKICDADTNPIFEDAVKVFDENKK